MRTMLAVALATVLLAGCGSSDDTPTTDPPTDPEPIGGTPSRSKIVEDAVMVCETATSRKQFAKDFGMSTTDPDALAERFARAYGPGPGTEIQARCLAFLRGVDP